MKGIPDYRIAISAVKLMRLGYIEKSVESGYNDNEEYFAYRATEDGLDVFLRHEGQYVALTDPRPPAPPHRPYPQKPAADKKPSSGFDDMDDDIPF